MLTTDQWSQKGSAVVTGSACAIVATSVWASFVFVIDGKIGPFDPLIVWSTLGALLALFVLPIFPKVRRAKSYPLWYFPKLVWSFAALIAVGALLLITIISWLFGSLVTPLFFRALIIALLLNALVQVWSLLVLNLYFLLRPTPPEPPPAAH